MEFFIVYIREAHPADDPHGGMPGAPDQPTTDDERREVASDCGKKIKKVPFLIDDMKNSADKAYAAWPDRIYVIDKKGQVAYKGGPGPFGFKPKEAEKALVELLGDGKDH